jgi:general stress protein 26
MSTEDLLFIARETVAQVTWCFAITAGEDGEINARLVQIGRLADDWSTRFLTDRRSRKVAEIERSGRLTLAYQHDPDRAYVTLVGRAEVVGDVEAKRAIWRPEMHRFHPGGPEDPNNVIARFTTDRIEMYSGARDVAPEPKGFSAAVLVRTGSGWRQEASFRPGT